ncbi:MAG: IS66 family transposase [Nitrososphaera sp.]|nr:IS66 family transposase [Nitrososphaera sp.]
MKAKKRCRNCRSLQQEIHRLEMEVVRLGNENEELNEKISRLKVENENLRRAGKRQAAPFSRRRQNEDARAAGRKSGSKYGKKARRRIPDHVDEIIEAQLPSGCPECKGTIQEKEIVKQFQADIPPVKPYVIQFNVHVGECVNCHQRVQGHHPKQTSDALGAACSQVGPRAIALAAQLNKELGVPFGKVARLYEIVFGLSISPGGICQRLHRVAETLEPTYDRLRDWIRHAPVVSPDETGWRVDGCSCWLWVFATPRIVLYSIELGRGFQEAASILGADFSGRLVRDGWSPYRSFLHAIHQTCLQHLLTRSKELLQTAVGEAAIFPDAVRKLLKHSLALRDRYRGNLLSSHGFSVAKARLNKSMDRLLASPQTDDENRKFAKHLLTERSALFTFLDQLDLPATNYPAEQAIRPAVITRKICGGNRSWKGAFTQQIILSFIRTCRLQNRNVSEILIRAMRLKHPLPPTFLIPRKTPSFLNSG